MARILVVEPDRRVRQFIAGILSDFGHRVEQCDDATGARRLLRDARFDVLATDLVLAANAVDDLPAAAEVVPVLTLSGRPFSRDGEPHERLRDKPFRFADLTTLVGAVFLVAAQGGMHAHALPGVGGN
jgi:CheY-like chemotaxis protein